MKWGSHTGNFRNLSVCECEDFFSRIEPCCERLEAVDSVLMGMLTPRTEALAPGPLLTIEQAIV